METPPPPHPKKKIVDFSINFGNTTTKYNENFENIFVIFWNNFVEALQNVNEIS